MKGERSAEQQNKALKHCKRAIIRAVRGAAFQDTKAVKEVISENVKAREKESFCESSGSRMRRL